MMIDMMIDIITKQIPGNNNIVSLGKDSPDGNGQGISFVLYDMCFYTQKYHYQRAGTKRCSTNLHTSWFDILQTRPNPS